jgi:hypothetical protein
MRLSRASPFLILAAAACEPVPRVGTGELSGLVLDARDQEPFAGAVVRGEPGGWEVTSDHEGRFAIALDAGVYEVSVVAQRRRPSEPVEVVVHREAVTEVTLFVPDAPDELRVRVPVGVVPAGYGKLVTIEAVAQDPEDDPLTYTWRQLSGPSIEASFQGQGTPSLTLRTRPLEDLVPLSGRFGPVAIPRSGQGEYLVEVEVSDGTHVVTGRTQVRSGTAQGNWPRLAAGVDGYFDCGDVPNPDFLIDSVSPCRLDEADCTPPEIEGADTCTPRVRGHYAGSFFLIEQTTHRRVLYEVGRWFGVNDEVSGCNRRDCHAAEADGWASTLHSTVFRRGIEGALREDYEPACARCHAMGNDVTARNHGFDDVALEAGWDWPERLEPGNWDAMPTELQGTANVQCSTCHAPAVFWTGLSVGVCAQCHDAPPTYTKVAEWRASPMSRFVRGLEADDPALDAACTRCHSAQGFIEAIRAERRVSPAREDPFPGRAELPDAGKVAPPTAADVEPITCATCHDAHSPNPRMLRVFGETSFPSHEGPVSAASSAVCLRCHNAQVDPRDPADLAARRAPMFGAQADLFYGTGAMGIDPVQDVPHAGAVGCVECHLRAPSDPALAGAAGGHTFLAQTADGRPNVAACADCHDAAQGFDVPAGGDWDGDAAIEAARAEVRGLLALARVTLDAAVAAAAISDCLGAAAAGAIEQDGQIVLVDGAGAALGGCGGEPVVVPDEHLDLHRAAFDILLVERDRSEGLHAPRYAAAALQAAIEALLVDSRPVWDPAL